MADVISLSSDSDNNEDSDVEIVGCYSNAMTRNNALPLSSVRVDVNAVSVNVPSPTRYIDLTDQKWSLPDLKLGNRKNSNTFEVVDLTEINVENGTDSLPLEDCLINGTDSLPLNDCLINETENLPLDDCSINGTENLPQDDSLIEDESVNKNQTATKLDDTVQKRPSTDQTVSEPQQDCGNQKSKHRRLDSETQHQKPTDKAHHCTSIVELRRLPFLETHATKLKTSNCSVHVTKDCTQMSLHFRKPERESEAPKSIRNLRASNGLHTETPADSPFSGTGSTVAMPKEDTACEEKADDDSPISMLTPCPTPPSSSQDKALDSSQGKVLCSDLEQLKLDTADSREGILSDHSSSSHSPSAGLNPSEPSDLDTRPHTSPTSNNQPDPTQTSEHTLVENTSNRQSEEVGADEASSSPEPALSLSRTDDPGDRCGTGTYEGDQGIDSPMSFVWQEGSDGETVNADNRFDMDFREASREDMYVCPVQLGKLMSGPPQVLINEEDDEFGDPEVLCRQSLSLVYSTIDENYPEGTLQLLSDLLQPGYYPPRDITFHLLQGILLNLKCPYHLCVQAYNLLMRTQRHQMADNTTVAWDWELLTSVMANQRHRCEVLSMLLDYVVQTLEDDFKAKRSTSAVHHSIAKATLSCDQQFPCVRDIIKWLFSAIMKSTEQGDSTRAARERDEQIRMVSIFQRMLFLALEVDRSPALNSAKLSQELFHMLIGNIPLRAHRMLLLGSLQSELLRCKLLEHLLDYACPLKISLPMSLSLLLHFLKNCTLAPDPTDGTERWHRWEELVHLLWMLLLSYNKAMKGSRQCLEPVGNLGLSECAICGAICGDCTELFYWHLFVQQKMKKDGAAEGFSSALNQGYLCSTVTEKKCGVGALVYRQDDMVSKPAVREAVEAFLSRSHADMGQALPLHVEESLTYLQDYLLDVCQC